MQKEKISLSTDHTVYTFQKITLLQLLQMQSPEFLFSRQIMKKSLTPFSIIPITVFTRSSVKVSGMVQDTELFPQCSTLTMHLIQIW